MSQPAARLYWHPISGHAHRAQLMLSLLGRPFELTTVDLKAGEQRGPAFLEINPLGEVPVLEDDGALIADSNAILIYLTRRYDPDGRWAPADPTMAARIQRWLSIAAGPLQQGPGALRLGKLFGLALDAARAEMIAAKLFGHMNAVLSERAHLAAEHATIADVALYSYTARAPEGGVDLAVYPAIERWLARIEALPGFAPMIWAQDAAS